MERHQGSESTSATGGAKPGTKTLNVSHSEKCDECGLILSSVHALRYHKDALHPKEKRFYTCHICSKVSPNERALKKHIKHMHVISLDYKCSVCGRGFKRSENLRVGNKIFKFLYTFNTAMYTICIPSSDL